MPFCFEVKISKVILALQQWVINFQNMQRYIFQMVLKKDAVVFLNLFKMNIFVNAQSDFVTQYSVKWLLYIEILNNLICVTLTNGMYTRERQISTWRTQSLLLCKATSCFAGRSPLKILTQNPVNSFCVSPANQCSCALLDNSLLKESLYTLTEKTR